VGDDISIRKRTEERMRLYDKMFATTAEPMLITDKDCNIIDINPAYLEVTGFSREEVIGNKPVIAQSGNHNKEYYKLMWDTIEQQGRWSGEIWDRRKSGELFPMWLTIDAIKDDFNRVINYIGVMKDVTLHKENEEKLERLAYFDPLTRLPNRQLYQDRLEHELAVAQRDKSRFAVFYIDLDYFKLVNDSLGHDAGDDLLVQVSERIKGCLRASDTVARMGGDEFNIIISITDGIKDIRIVAQKIIDELHRSFILRGKEVKIGCSIGISIYPDDSIELDELGKKADMAMYQAKGSGRGCYLFFSEGEKAAKDNHQ
jgi:diguanylate cyclase (GGDEF)-like protein/PAS domain S-box-containing protein